MFKNTVRNLGRYAPTAFSLPMLSAFYCTEDAADIQPSAFGSFHTKRFTNPVAVFAFGFQ
jgi:hypothetical protein